ncbi:hypothetical protein GCM10028803_47310 [Larkinella knui]
MAEVIVSPKDVIKKMAEDQRKIEEYIKSGDKSKKPAGIKFVNPFNVSSRRG